MQCSSCQQDSAPEALYCAHCGAALASSGEPAAAPAPRRTGERRQLTVLFCDLVDSTTLGEALDPEDLRSVLNAYQDACAQIVAKFEGYVAEYQGDGMLAYFSYPQAHEDDPERAVRAGLEIVAAVRRIDSPQPASRLRARVGIHTGRVLVGPLGKRRDVAMGHALNVASRIQTIAAPDSVVLSDETRQLVSGRFVTESLGAFDLKGIRKPVPVFRALRATGVGSRLDGVPASELTELTGRESDLAALLERWQQVRDGAGVAVLIGGEAGIGKSRLLRALHDRLEGASYTWLECRASPHLRNTALHPIVELLERGLRFQDLASEAEKLAAIERALELSDIDRDTFAPILAQLLSVPLPGGRSEDEIGAETRRRRTLEVLTRWFTELARLQPMVAVVEDLHWADPSSLELVERLIEQTASAPVLLLLTHRPSFEPGWELPGLVRHEVKPLPALEAARMVERVHRGSALAPETVRHIVGMTDGIPLFIEELTKGAPEGDASGEMGIPASLQDALMARLDRLGTSQGKEVAQLAAVIGRDFSYPALAAVSELDAASLDAALERLVEAGLLHRRGEAADAAYTFKHALIQEAAEQSLLRGMRSAWHARVARVLEERFPERVAAEPELMAQHCHAGGLLERAAAYFQRAAVRATERSANVEAIAHLERALEVAAELPESRERSLQELELHSALGAAFGATKGWGSPEAARAYQRARELSDELGESPTLFPVLRGLVTYYTTRAELGPAVELCERLVRFAHSHEDSSYSVIAQHQTGLVHCFLGDVARARNHFEQALSAYEPDRHRHLASVYQADPGVLVRSWMSWPLWLGGAPDQALRRCREAIGRAAGHPFSLAQALASAAVVHLWRREHKQAGALAEQALAIARERDFAALVGGCTVSVTLSRMHLQPSESEFDQALKDFGGAVAQLAKLGSNGSIRPLVLGLLAEVLLLRGREEPARAAVEACLAFSAQTGAKFWDAELHRVKAALLAPTSPDAALRELDIGLEVARAQGARMLELRIAADRLDASAPGVECDAAREQLARIHGFFHEGLELLDLERARQRIAQAS